MKYLEDEKLTQWTSELSDAVLAGRVINGRIEAYTMKRAGTDKKYAHALGEKFVAEMEQKENQMAGYHDFLQKREDARNRKRRSVSVGEDPVKSEPSKKIQRARAISFDEISSPGIVTSVLGDFQEIGTRRLMTDLILTLNSSFPDYDFGNVRPCHFSKKTAKDAMEDCNFRLSELASRRGEYFVREMWSAIDNVVCLAETEVYSYVPPACDDDPTGFLSQTLLDSESDSVAPLWSFNYFFVNKNLKRILLFSCIETMVSNEVSDEEDEQLVTVGKYKTDEGDFDIDPASDIAGGIPV
mmetsp:Transcript_1684/g.2479  ORF Transcript_1684/g.2479 Transcript_1684/m.2479 type:complete len:298 (+) Transcript_1684:290-1183(+)|eukprot:CAMPEP_0194209720 /NCGR_PEP_ID=MMETSP0156-20130528/7737_1 /TAXON_ID=33649 /ORGANISM="Thalassionema nitzschioides, Strain L26-B" /LENGTH=297 /DNA_ID=CAMNT_0038936929 /DNA_START=237 /DNA_END=1130 /DNA_ORIENTATION=-